MRSQEPFEQCRWLFSSANHNSLCLQISGTKVWVKRRTSRMPNLRLMSKIYYYRLLALGSTRDKEITNYQTKSNNKFLINCFSLPTNWWFCLIFARIRSYCDNHFFILLSSTLLLKIENGEWFAEFKENRDSSLLKSRENHITIKLQKHVYIFLNFQQYFTNQ